MLPFVDAAYSVLSLATIDEMPCELSRAVCQHRVRM